MSPFDRRGREKFALRDMVLFGPIHWTISAFMKGQFSCALCTRPRTMSLALPNDLELPGFIVGEEKFVFLICLVGGLMVIFDQLGLVVSKCQ